MSTAGEAAETLVLLAEEGCALAAAGRLDELADQQGAWQGAVDSLRGHAALTHDVEALLDRALALQGEQAAILAAARSEVAGELGRLRRTRAGARGYASTIAGPRRGLEATA